mgnify:CR=1 FL=1
MVRPKIRPIPAFMGIRMMFMEFWDEPFSERMLMLALNWPMLVILGLNLSWPEGDPPSHKASEGQGATSSRVDWARTFIGKSDWIWVTLAPLWTWNNP